MPQLEFTLAGAQDEPELRRLLRENPIPGQISLSFEREPDYFLASALEGDFHQTIVAREQNTGRVIACGNRAIRPLYINGQVQDTGYMSQLRVDPAYAKGLYLARGLAGGFRKYHQLHQDGRAPFYLMSVISDNLAARRLLTSGLPDYPEVVEYAPLCTYAIYPTRPKAGLPAPEGRPLRLRRARPSETRTIVDYLNRSNAGSQFAPYWSAETLYRFGLEPEDFTVALSGGQIVGCLACWDQSAYKQTVVRGYQGKLGRWRWLINLAARLSLAPRLPDLGQAVRHAYASHLAVDDDDPQVFARLLRTVYNRQYARGYSYFMVGLAQDHPLEAVVRSYRPIIYRSQLYCVSWGQAGRAAIAAIDRSLRPAPEIALL